MPNTLARELPLPCGAVVPNRLLKSAMTEGLAGPDGQANARHQALYKAWSLGGAGILVTGNVMVDRNYLERPGNVVIDGDEDLGALRAWAKAGTTKGNHLWMQISHPGRQCTRIVSGKPIAPSAVQLKLLGYFARPRAMQSTEIRATIHRYAHAARVARETGFTGVQVHAAHGYLINQFLSPTTNRRTDAWGGCLENRARFLLETVRAVRSAVGNDYPLAVKLNSADFQKGGFTLEDSAQVAVWLEAEGVDLLEISGGTYEQLKLLGYEGNPESAEQPKRASTRQREAYFLDYAQVIRQAVKLPLAVTGGFRSAEIMVDSVASGEVDVIGLARPLCVDPEIPAKLIAGTAQTAPAPENTLQLGNGILGPNSRNNTFKSLNALGIVAWFCAQMTRIAAHQPTDLQLSLRRALLSSSIGEIRLGLARRRFLRTHPATEPVAGSMEST